MQTKKVTINIFKHQTLRDFLKSYSHAMRATQPSWTLSKWARDIGLQSTTSLTMIINGQRNCGSEIERKIIQYFQFSPDEELYFKLLVAQDKKSIDDIELEYIDTKIKTLRNQKESVVLSAEQFELINKWYFLALRQLARIQPLKLDEEWLRSKINYHESASLKDALLTLADLGLLKYENNLLVATNNSITTTDHIQSSAIQGFHSEMGQLALQALQKIPVESRNFQGCTLLIKKEEIQKANDLIEKFFDDFSALVDTNKGDHVYQLNLQLFPLASSHES